MATIVDDPYGVGGSGFGSTRNRNTGGRGGGDLFPALPMMSPFQSDTRGVRAFDPGNIGPVTGPVATTAATPAATLAPTVPAPNGLNTLYGVDSESYLTDDQRKLARQIQGQFDASANRRDRELARYGAPMLSSFAEDESLARAMSLARGLNTGQQTVVDPITGQARVPSGGGGGGGGGATPRLPILRDPTMPVPKMPPPGLANKPNWQQIMTGLASLAPILFGRDAYGEFINKGVFPWLKEKLFGPGNGTNMSDEQLERLLDSQGANNSWDILPDAVNGPQGSVSVSSPLMQGSYDEMGYWTPSGGYDYSSSDPFGVGGYDWSTPAADVNWWDLGDAGGGWGDFSWGDFGY